MKREKKKGKVFLPREDGFALDMKAAQEGPGVAGMTGSGARETGGSRKKRRRSSGEKGTQSHRKVRLPWQGKVAREG